MTRWFRPWLMWCLMLCVPLQGMAASTMALCGPGAVHGLATVVDGPRTDAASAVAGHAEHTGHDHPAMTESAEAVDSAHGDLAHADDHKCSVCASCHSAAALVTELPSLPAIDAASTVFAAIVLSVAAFAADGPERPPRCFLA